MMLLIILVAQAAARDILAAQGHSVEHQLSLGGLGRALAQDGSGSVGLFEDLMPCAPLLNILTDRSKETSRWGYFREPPTEEMILECVDNSSLAITDGRQFIFAFTTQYPVVKVMQVQSVHPIVVPASNYLFRAGAILILDCQDTWLDVRELPNLPLIDAVTVYVRCPVLMSKTSQLAGNETWMFSSSTHRKCEVRFLS